MRLSEIVLFERSCPVCARLNASACLNARAVKHAYIKHVYIKHAYITIERI